MRLRSMPLACLLCLALTSASAALSGVQPSVVRNLVEGGQAISTRQALAGLGLSEGDQVIDIHAFRGSHLYYRIVILHASGKLGAFIVDATTGQGIVPSSAIAKAVEAAAAASAAPGRVVDGLGRASSKAAEAAQGRASKTGGGDAAPGSTGTSADASENGNSSGGSQGNAGDNSGGGGSGGGGNAGGGGGGGNAGGNSGGNSGGGGSGGSHGRSGH